MSFPPISAEPCLLKEPKGKKGHPRKQKGTKIAPKRHGKGTKRGKGACCGVLVARAMVITASLQGRRRAGFLQGGKG